MPEIYVLATNCKIINHKSQIAIFIPAVILTVGIAIVSLIENPHLPAEIAMRDKLMHGLMYTFLAVAWILPLTIHPFQTTSNNFKPLKPYTLVCLSVTAYGAILELLQHYCTLTRSGEWLDVLADFIGALLGVGIVAIVKWLNEKM